MGHDIRVHREYYRLHESGAGLSQQIMALVDEGNFQQAIGKPLNEVEVDAG